MHLLTAKASGRLSRRPGRTESVNDIPTKAQRV